MKQLTLGDILDFAKDLKKNGMTDKEIKSLPIYLGDDDELNGIHCGWYTDLIDTDNADDMSTIGLMELINENRCNIKLETGKAILIS